MSAIIATGNELTIDIHANRISVRNDGKQISLIQILVDGAIRSTTQRMGLTTIILAQNTTSLAFDKYVSQNT